MGNTPIVSFTVRGKKMEFTGERVIEGKTPQRIWLDHIARYEFTSKYFMGKMVMDVACGTGHGSRMLYNRGKAKKVVSIDISKDSIDFTCARCKGDGLEFRVGYRSIHKAISYTFRLCTRARAQILKAR